MNVSTTIPTTVQIRRSRLLGLVGGVAAVAAFVTWAVTAFAVDNGTTSAQKSVPAQPAVVSLAIPASGYLDALRSASLGSAAIPASGYLDALRSSSTGYLNAIISMTPAQLRAAFGTGGVDAIDALGLSPKSEQYVRTIVSMTPAQLRAAFGTGGVDARTAVLASLTPSERKYVKSIMAMSPAQLKAAFGTGK